MMTILTDAALAAETIWVTQSTKQWIVLIDVDDRVVGKAATLSRQESRRIDFAWELVWTDRMPKPTTAFTSVCEACEPAGPPSVAGAQIPIECILHQFVFLRFVPEQLVKKDPLMFYYEVTQACDLVCKHCRASAGRVAN